MQKAVAVVNDLWWNRHGFPQGYHFVPSDHELIRLLEDIIAGRPLPYPLPSIFRNVRIGDYHPAELYERYKAHQEAGCIYFFSQREFPGSARVRPRRFTKDGWWKASGGGEALKRGSKLTLVFYDRKPGQKLGVKTNWAIKEYTKILDKKKKAEEMALYRLYKMKKSADAKQATREDEPEEDEEAPPPSPPHPPAGGAFLQAQAGQPHDYHNYYACDAAPGPSTSCSATPDARYMGPRGSSPAAATYTPQRNVVQHTNGLGFWDKLPAMVPSLVSSGPAAVAHGLPTSAAHFSYQETALDAEHFGYQETAVDAEHFGYQETAVDAEHLGYQETTDPLKTQLLPASAEQFVYQETTDPLKTQLLPTSAEHFVYQETTDPLKTQLLPASAEPKTQLLPPLPAPAAQGGYLADEFDVWCEMQQGSQQVAVSPSSPTPDDIDSQPVAVSFSSPMPNGTDSQQVAVSPSSPTPDDIDSRQVATSFSSPIPDDIDSQQVAACPFPKLEDVDFPMLEDVDFPMLEDVDFTMLEDIDSDGLLEDMLTMPMDENGERFSCTIQELLYPQMDDDAPPPLADVDGQGSGSE